MANQKNEKKKSIAGKYAEFAHISRRRALKEFNLIATIIDEKTVKDLQLSDEESEYLNERKEKIKEELKVNLVQVK